MSKKFKYVLLTTILVFLILEFVLQILSLVVSFNYSEVPELKGELVIVCVGESTTKDQRHESEKMTYPQILERELKKFFPKKTIRVINEGHRGRSTRFLVQRLNSHIIPNLNPDIVITMMGINDSFFFIEPIDFNLSANWQAALLKSRLYKLGVMLYTNYLMPISLEKESKQEQDLASESVQDLQSQFTKMIRLHHGLNKSESIRGEIYNLAKEYIERVNDKYWVESSNTVNIGRSDLVENYLDAFSFLTDYGYERESTFKILFESSKLHPKSEILKGKLCQHYKKREQDEYQACRSELEKILQSTMLEETIKNYRTYANTLRGKGIRHIVMGYPTRSLEPLKWILWDYGDNIQFIENKINFRQGLSKYSYSELFNDSFAGEFGHLTIRGNQLLVKNVLKHLLNQNKFFDFNTEKE